MDSNLLTFLPPFLACWCQYDQTLFALRAVPHTLPGWSQNGKQMIITIIWITKKTGALIVIKGWPMVVHIVFQWSILRFTWTPKLNKQMNCFKPNLNNWAYTALHRTWRRILWKPWQQPPWPALLWALVCGMPSAGAVARTIMSRFSLPMGWVTGE